MKNPSRLHPSSTPSTAIVKYTKMVRPKRRYWVWQRAAGFLTLLLTFGLLAAYFLYQHAQPLTPRPAPLQVVAAAVSDSSLLRGTLRQGPTTTPSVTEGTNLFAAPDATPAPALNQAGSIFGLPTDEAPVDLLGAPPAVVSTTTTAADPLVSAAKAQPQLYNTFLSAQDALQQDDPEQAIATLLTLTQNHPAYLAEQVTAVLYTAYLAAGDQHMREGERAIATDFYDRAQQLAVPDQSALNRRLTSLTRFLNTTTSATTASSAALAEETTTVTAPTAEAAVPNPVSTPIAEPTPIPAFSTVVTAPSATCPNAQVTITAPTANALLTGAVGFSGSAVQENLWFYKLEWAPAGSETFAYFAGSRLAVTDGWLGTLDTTMLVNGDYVIRLTVVDATGNYPQPCDLPMRVEN